MSKLSQIIQNLGFSDNESKIYLALLELGTAHVSQIASKSEVKRTSCYIILEELTKKGLSTKTQVKGKLHYMAEPPERLATLAQERQEHLRAVMPEFKSLFNLSETKPRIRFYEGNEGYVSICEDSLKRSDDEILFISNLDNLRKVITAEYDQKVYIPARIRDKKNLRMLTFKSPNMEKMRNKDTEEFRSTRFLPDKMKFDATMFIYGDTISIISSEKELIGLVIDSKPIAAMAKVMFEGTWQMAT